MNTPRIINTLLVSLVSLSALAQASGRPRLVVGITVDQLRTDPLEQLRGLFGENGFRRLMQDGVYLKNVEFGGITPDIASGAAQVLTGAYPATTGISGAEIYDTSMRQWRKVLAPQGSYTPEPLLLSTVADEVAIDGIGLGAIYSVAASPELAVIGGGHAANAAVWIDENTGRWTTSPYYREQPRAMSARNSRSPLSSRIDTMQWKPLQPLDKYIGLPAQKRLYPFRHTYPSSRRDSYGRFASSAPGNAEVTDMAIDFITTERLGNRGDAIDMINIGYSLAPCRDVADGDYRLEQQDAYLRLDADLNRLFSALHKQIGMENVVVWMLPTGYYSDAVEVDAKYRIPGGEFSVKRCISLLNSYLGAKYGNAEWVVSMRKGEVHLNATALENYSRGRSEAAILDDARDFLSRMSGVAEVYTISDILRGDTPELRNLAKSVTLATSGHLLVKVRPGWKIIDESHTPPHVTPVRTSQAMTPAFLLAPSLKATEITVPVEAVEIAPTLTRTLRIRAPNGAEGKGLAF